METAVKKILYKLYSPQYIKCYQPC